MEKVRFTRLELYNLVWELPLHRIVKEYNIPRAGIKIACLRMEIPLPGSNHWTKSPYLKGANPILSTNYLGIKFVEIEQKKYELQLRKTSKPTPLLDLAKMIQQDPNAPLKVGKVLVNPNKIINETRLFWKDKDILKDLLQDSDQVLFLNVLKENFERALCFMDALIKLLEYRGYQFGVGEEGTGIIIVNQKEIITLKLREALKRIPPKAGEDSSFYVGTNQFVLRISNGLIQHEWRDKKVFLEEILHLIVAKIELLITGLDTFSIEKV